MKMSEYIRSCEALLTEHGDLEVTDSMDEPIAEPELSEDLPDMPASFVIAEKA